MTTAVSLCRALLWRARREGFGAIFVFPLLTTAAVGVAMLLAARYSSIVNVPDVPFSGPLGVSTHDARLALAVASAPTLLILGVTLGGGRCVQSLVGAEATSGAAEMWLAEGLTAAQVVVGTWLAIAVAVMAIWLATSMLVCAALVAATRWLGTGVHLTWAYGTLLLVVPLVLGLAGTLLAVGLAFARPRLLQASERGIARGTGNIVGTVAALPGFATILAVIIGSEHGLSAGALVAASAGLTAVLAATGALLGLRFTSREGLVGSL